MGLRFGIVGAGGIGGYLAARLTDAGVPVALLARGGHLSAIRDDGLRLIDPEGDLTVTPDLLGDDPAMLAGCDVIVFAVKAHQLPDAIAQVAPHAGPAALTLPFQNGVDAPGLLAEAFGADRALTGVAQIFANITAPGVVTRYGAVRNFQIGPQDRPEVDDIRATLLGAGVHVPHVADIAVALWSKFVLFNAMSSVTAAARCTFGPMRANPETMALTERLMAETAAVARAEGVDLPADIVPRTMEMFARLPDGGRTSTAHDLANGKPLEIDWISGAVVRRGRALGVPVPASEAVFGLLAPWREGAPS